jgi:hypothetical protein
LGGTPFADHLGDSTSGDRWSRPVSSDPEIARGHADHLRVCWNWPGWASLAAAGPGVAPVDIDRYLVQIPAARPAWLPHLQGADYGCHSQALVTLSAISSLPYVMMHFFADDGEKIHLQVSGGGSPIIMLHGWTASHREWSALSRSTDTATPRITDGTPVATVDIA